jgi:hypothetical protein
MLLVDAIALYIQANPNFIGVAVRVFVDDAEEDEQVLVSPSQGYTAASQAPLYSPQITIETRAITHERASWLCVQAYKAIERYIPREESDYAHGPPQMTLAPGFIAYDDRDRPVYSFMAMYMVTPEELL